MWQCAISSAMKELCDQNPSITRMELMKSGMQGRTGYDGTDSNTLILAFAGSSVSMLLMDYAYDLPFLQIINSNNIGMQSCRGFPGSFGIVLSVPVTVIFAAFVYCRKK